MRRFAKVGYAATSTRDICADLKIAHSAIYNYFPSKKTILAELTDRLMSALLGELDDLLAKHTDAAVEVRIGLVMRQVADGAIRNRNMWKVLGDAVIFLEGELRSLAVSRRDRFEQIFRNLLAEAVAKGAIPAQDVTMSGRHVIRLLTGPTSWYKPSGPLTRDEIVENVCAFAYRGIGMESPALDNFGPRKTAAIRAPAPDDQPTAHDDA